MPKEGVESRTVAADARISGRVHPAVGKLVSRRTFLTRAGLLGGLAALGQLPLLLREQGLLDKALAQELPVVHQALNGLVAFVVPGPDPYSKAQGQTSPTPGGIDAGATAALIELLDDFVPVAATGLTVPASGGVAVLLDETALQVNPVATGGGFVSPFARLRFDEKVEAMRRIEELTEADAIQGVLGELRFVSGILIGATAFVALGEADVLDPETRELTGTPVGWQITGYDGIAEGWDEFKGYWQGRRRVRTSRRYREPRRGRTDA